ncbi:MAG: putative polysaccharide export protein, partial [Phycisphaerales bacterium]|nr:putative polysaccharide export protein [Phycisphaerales bacterium]
PPRLKAGESGDGATRPAATDASGTANAADAKGIEPEDLKEDRNDYRISRSDLLSITLTDLNGPGRETLKTTRVTETGSISLPYIGSVKATGRTEAELEADIARMFKDGKLVANMPVSVQVIEARGRAFSIVGGIEKPGEYAIPDAKFRLLDAIALAGGARGEVRAILIVRQAGAVQPKGKENDPPATRKIEIPGPKLLAGDPNLNVFVRPHDTIVISAAPNPPAAPAPKSVELRIGKDGLRFEGNPVTWDQLAAALEKLPDHPGTVLNIAADSEDVTVGTFFDAQSKAAELVRKYGFKQLTTTGVAAKKAAGAAADDIGFEIFVGGHIARPGVYSTGHAIKTLQQMLDSAGGPDPGLPDNTEIIVTRPKTPTSPEQVRRTTLRELRESKDANFELRGGEQIMVIKRP